MCDFGQGGIGGGRQRLLHELHLQFFQFGSEAFDHGDVPAFVRVDDDGGFRQDAPHRADPVQIALAGQFHLDQRTMGVARGRRRHFLGRSDAQGKRRRHRLGCGKAGQLPNPRPRPFRLQVPEGAVHRVARGPGPHRLLQAEPVQFPGLDIAAHGLDLGQGAVLGLVVARIGLPLAPAPDAVLLQRTDDHRRLRPAAARDREHLAQRPGFGIGGQAGHGPAIPARRPVRRRRASPDRWRAGPSRRWRGPIPPPPPHRRVSRY